MPENSERPGGQAIAPKRSSERARKKAIYTRRQIGTMAIAVLIGAVAVWSATRLLAVQDPPSTTTQPVLDLILSRGGQPAQEFSWARNIEYKVFETFRRCQNPVSVQVDAVVNGRDIGGPTMAPGFADGELTDPSDAVGQVRMLFDHGTPQVPRWVVTQPTVMRRTVYAGVLGVVFGVVVHQWYPSAVLFDTTGTDTVPGILFEIRFTANWILPRSDGTCFVRFPALQVRAIDPVDPPNTPPLVAPPGPGQVTITSKTGDVADWQDSLPPPADPQVPRWSCARMGNSGCTGGVAVFSAAGANAHVSLWLLIDGALIGVAAALFAEPATQFGRGNQPEVEQV